METDLINQDAPFVFNEINLQKIKENYLREIKDDPNNPIKVCMKLVFEAAIEKDPTQRDELAISLSKFLIQPRGVVNLFLTIIDFDSSSQKVTTLNQRFIAVANIITCLPKLCLPYSEYCGGISKQLKTFLISDNPKYSTLASIIIKSMIESPHANNKNIPETILNPIFNSLSLEGRETFLKPCETIIAIFNLIQNHVPSYLFVDIFSNLFYVFYCIMNTPSRYRIQLEFILTKILNDLKPGSACCLLERTIFYDQHLNVYKPHADNDEISFTILDNENCDEKSIKFEELREMVMKILDSCESKKLVLEFFFHCQSKIWSITDENRQQQYSLLIEPLLKENHSDTSSYLDILSCMTDYDYALELIYRTLINYVDSLRSQGDNLIAKDLVSSSINNCLSILEILASSSFDQNQMNTLQQKVGPVLDEMKSQLSKIEIDQNMKLTKKLNQLIDRLAFNIKQDAGKTDTFNTSMAEYNNTIKDLNDKLVPVRVHALVKFKQMIMANDQYTISKIPQLFDLVEGSLADQEPYVFLACINLIAEMTIRKTEQMLPKLIDLYAKQELDVRQRINIGEVLVRLGKRLDKTAPYYARQVINMLIKGTTDSEELLRMSSLTNIGELCRNLGDSLGKYMLDILSLVKHILNNDTILVKCAAIDLLRCSLSGLDKFKVESVQLEMKSIYSLLKRLKTSTLDEKLSLQLELALDELNRLAKEMLGIDVGIAKEKDDLVKSIKVLSLLDKR